MMAFAYLPLPKIRNQSKIVTNTDQLNTNRNCQKQNHVANIHRFYMNQIHHGHHSENL